MRNTQCGGWWIVVSCKPFLKSKGDQLEPDSATLVSSFNGQPQTYAHACHVRLRLNAQRLRSTARVTCTQFLWVSRDA